MSAGNDAASAKPVDGHGRWTFADGDAYDGEWKGGCMHGKGVYRFHNGVTYEGDFVKGLQHGVGTMFYADIRDKYVGEWKNGKRHGKGATICASGCVFEAEYTNGKMHGHVSFQYAVDGRPDRQDLDYSWDAGDRFVGAVVDGVRHGPCVYTFFTGEKFACTWVNGRCPEFAARQRVVRAQQLGAHSADAAAVQRRADVEQLVDASRQTMFWHHALSAAKHLMTLAVQDTMVPLAIARVFYRTGRFSYFITRTN
jgi:hypothetical protein